MRADQQVSITVVDAQTNRPITGALLVVSGSGDRRGLTDALGRTVVPLSVLEGTEVLVSKEGYRPFPLMTSQLRPGRVVFVGLARIPGSASPLPEIWPTKRGIASSPQSMAAPQPKLQNFQKTFEALSRKRLVELRALPSDLSKRKSLLETNKPPANPTLVRDEFESTALFTKRASEAREGFERAIRTYNLEVGKLNADIAEFESRAPRVLPIDRMAGAAAEALVAVYGDPVLSNVRYDADTLTFFADLDSTVATDLGLPRTVALGKQIPNLEAKAFKDGLIRSRPEIAFTLAAEGRLRFFGARVVLSGDATYALLPAQADYRAVFTPVGVPLFSAVEAIARTGTLESIKVPGIWIDATASAGLAKLQREVESLERQKRLRDLDAARRQELERRKQEIETELASSGGGGPDDLYPRLLSMRPAPLNPHRWLFAVGVRDYSEIAPVSFGDNAVALFSELAKRRLGVPEQNIFQLANRDATGNQIKSKLKKLLDRVKPGDTLYVYFAGHGMPSHDGQSTYVLPSDVGEGTYEDEDFRLDRLYERLLGSSAAKIVVVLDTCFSGRIGPKGQLFRGVAPIQLAPRAPGIDAHRMTILVAAEGNQFANEYRDRSNRLFTYFVVKGLLDGKTSVADLYRYVRDQVDEEARKKGPDYVQTPVVMGATGGIVP